MSGRASKWILLVVLPVVLALYASYPPAGVQVQKAIVEVHTAETEEEAKEHGVKLGQDYDVTVEVKESRFLPLALGKKDEERRFLERLEDGTVLVERTRTARGRVKLGLDLAGGTELLYQLKPEEGESLSGSLAATIDILKKRIDPSNVKEYRIQPLEQSRILIQVPQATASEVAQLKNRLQRMGKLEFRIAVPRPDATTDDVRFIRYYEEAAAGEAPEGFVRMHVDGDPEKPYYLVRKGEPEITGQYLNPGELRPTTDTFGRPAVGFQFNALGLRKFAGITERNQGWALAIVLDGVLKSAPTIEHRIHGPGIITGDFSQADVQDIVNILRAGSLPMDIELLQENTVGPQLGRDSIRKGLTSLAVAGLLVLLFVGIYYLRCGLVADAALILNLVFLVGVLCILGAALTLPGMAGILLTVGMAVDANVLIFERIREESAAGKAVRIALRNGYERAFTTIVDANVTTLLTAIILYLVGTGPVRGFAVTLSFGILLSMFTALVLTRLAFETFIEKGWLSEFRMLSIVGDTQIDFARLRRPAAVGSAALLLLGMVAFFARGADLYDIDFTGGSLARVSLAQPTPVGEVRALLAESGFPDAEVQAIRTAAATAEGTTDFGIRIKGARVDTDALLAGLRQKLTAAALMAAGDKLELTKDGRGIRLSTAQPVMELDLRRALGEGGDPYDLPGIDAVVPEGEVTTRHITVRLAAPRATGGRRESAARMLKALAWLGLERVDYAITKCEVADAEGAGPGPAELVLELDRPVQAELLAVELGRRQFGSLGVRPVGEDGTQFRLLGERSRLEEFCKELPAGSQVSVPDGVIEPPAVTVRLAKELTEQDVRAQFEQQGFGDVFVVALDSGSQAYRLSLSTEQVREQMEDIFAGLARAAAAVVFEPLDEPAAPEGRRLVKMTLGEPMAFADVRSQMEEAGLAAYGADAIVGAADYAPGVVVSELTLSLPSESAQAVQASIAEAFNRPEAVEKIVRIGATVAQEMQGKALLAIVFASVIIVLYVAVRFHAFRFGVAAVVALAHDVLITVGLIALADWLGVFGDVKINLAMLAAFLTILGYSLNDTIVVFDRIRENMASLGRKAVNADLINLSINQTLSRTLLTSLTTLMVVVVLYIFGGSVLQGLALTLIIGVVVGTYSSVFIASPVLLDWPRYFACEPRVPGVVRLWGLLMAVGGPVLAAFGAVGCVVELVRGEMLSAGVYALVWMVPGALGFVVGQGLRHGRRLAVYGLTGLAALAFACLACLAQLGWYGLELGTVSQVIGLLAIWAFAYLPPLVSAWRHMDAFRKGG